jgi:hypothetical protein
MSNVATIKGTITKFGEVLTGTGQKGAWKKREIHIESGGQYPKLVVLTAWGYKCDSISGNYNVGDSINVQCHIESMVYNDRSYTEVKPFKVVEDLD